jgi:hypothetical protein
MFVNGKFDAVELVQTVLGSNPDITVLILENLVYKAVGDLFVRRIEFPGLPRQAGRGKQTHNYYQDAVFH